MGRDIRVTVLLTAEENHLVEACRNPRVSKGSHARELILMAAKWTCERGIRPNPYRPKLQSGNTVTTNPPPDPNVDEGPMFVREDDQAADQLEYQRAATWLTHRKT